MSERKTKSVLTRSSALIIVDVQNDFCPEGALPVPYGDRVVPVLNNYIDLFQRNQGYIFATRDWHPPNHISFKKYGGIWPVHCVKGSEGAKFHPDLRLPSTTRIISKATLPNKEAYSGFDGTDLNRDLKNREVKKTFIGGLATDYCVKHTVLDALNLGYEVALLIDATRGVNMNPRDSENAIEEMTKKNAEEMTYSILELKN